MNSTSIGRFEGRLFADAGRLYLVVEANELSGSGRVSYREDGENKVKEMPLSEISKLISRNSELRLDNTGGPIAVKRLIEKPDGWFFSTREGLKGPFPNSSRSAKESRPTRGGHSGSLSVEVPDRSLERPRPCQLDLDAVRIEEEHDTELRPAAYRA